MKLVEFKESLISIAKQKFPHAKLTIIERRNITIEVRVDISDKKFIEVYHNIFSEKKSFALIMNGRRVFGYDNYKYWHMHPMNKVEMHIPCEEPVMEVVFEEIEQKYVKSRN